MVTPERTMPDGKTMKDEAEKAVLARIDNYELLRELGGGGFGTVYLARDTVSGVEYAVKGLPPFIKNNREELENIKANFTLVSRLSHTNIARAHVLHLAKEVTYNSPDVRQKLRVDPGDILMVMEFAPGITLTQWRRRFTGGKVPVGQALEIVRQIASALDYAHEQKILHRDVKPANVMIETRLDGKLVVRVVDFGLAAEIRTSMGRVSREIHDTSGTRPYMAPEQWLGGRQGPATDQYALAVLFHELVTGDVPFASVFSTGDPVVMMNVIGREPFASPADLPESVRVALDKALAKKPEERFGSCTEFVDALEERVAPSASRWKWWGLCGMCAVALVGLGTWLLVSRNGKTSPKPPYAPEVGRGVPDAPPTTGVPPVADAQERVPPALDLPQQSRNMIQEAMKVGDDLCRQFELLEGEHWKELQDYVKGTNLLAQGSHQFEKKDLTSSLASVRAATNLLSTAYNQEKLFLDNERLRLEEERKQAEAQRLEDERKRAEEEAEQAERKAREEAERKAQEKAAAEQAREQACKAKDEAEENNASQFAWRAYWSAVNGWEEAERNFNVGKFEDSKRLYRAAAREFSDVTRNIREHKSKELEDKKAKTEEFLAACRNEQYREAAQLVSVIDTENVSVQFYLGVMYANDSSGVKNEAESKKWYQKAADGGHEKAKEVLELIKQRDTLIRQRDETQQSTTLALQAFRNAQWFDGFTLAKNADKNNADIQYFIGFCHLYGYGGAVHSDFEAAKWFRQSANQNHLAAQACLGGMYLGGRGVQVNVKEGIRLIRNAAAGDNAQGMRLLALAYDNGIGVPKDKVQAVRYMSKAEEAGDPEAAQHMQQFRTRFFEFAVKVLSKGAALMEMCQQYNPDWYSIQRLSAELIVDLTELQALGNGLQQYLRDPRQAQQSRQQLQQLQQLLNELRQINLEAGRMLQNSQGLSW